MSLSPLGCFWLQVTVYPHTILKRRAAHKNIPEVAGARLFQCLKNVIKDPGSWQLSILPASSCWLGRSFSLSFHRHKMGVTVKAFYVNTITSGWRKWMLPLMSHALLGEKYLCPKPPRKFSFKTSGPNWAICLLQIECLCPFKNSYVEILTSKVMVLGGGTFGGDQIIQTQLLWMGLMLLWKRPKKSPSPLALWEDTVRQLCLWGSRLSQTSGNPAPWPWTSQSPELWEISVDCL